MENYGNLQFIPGNYKPKNKAIMILNNSRTPPQRVFQKFRLQGLHGGLKAVALVLCERIFWYLLDPVTYTSMKLFITLGYWPNIKKPRTLSEKIAHRRIFNAYPNIDLARRVVDKWRVREYVADIGLSQILNEVYYVTDRPETIPFDDLPDQFVVKLNRGSGYNLFVRSKSEINRDRLVKALKKWLLDKPYKFTHVPLEDTIKPLILIEKLLVDTNYGFPLSYRFFVIGGKARFIEVEPGKYSAGGRRSVIYDTDWCVLDFTRGLARGFAVPKPTKLKEMVEIAEKLTGNFGFSRIDLYLLNNSEIKLSEITISPGVLPFNPCKYDFIMGAYWV